ncbi:MAG TPA: HD domain-containing protein [Flavisolibacter sp.]|jgi:(p)ppGpp synthase/HD superfamily hydrolase
MDSILEQVREFADKAHGTQVRKYASERYIAHPVRVMEMCRRYTSSLPILAAALLHDVLEDTGVDQKALHGFLRSTMNDEDAKQTLNLVVELTDVYVKSAYPRWNRRKRKTKEAERISKTSPDSQTIKYADIIDNCREIAEHDPDFAGVFLLECKMLLRKIPEGQPELYREATDTVELSLRQVPRKFRRA